MHSVTSTHHRALYAAGYHARGVQGHSTSEGFAILLGLSAVGESALGFRDPDRPGGSMSCSTSTARTSRTNSADGGAGTCETSPLKPETYTLNPGAKTKHPKCTIQGAEAANSTFFSAQLRKTQHIVCATKLRFSTGLNLAKQKLRNNMPVSRPSHNPGFKRAKTVGHTILRQMHMALLTQSKPTKHAAPELTEQIGMLGIDSNHKEKLRQSQGNH